MEEVGKRHTPFEQLFSNCWLLINFQSFEKVDSDHFASNLVAFVEEQIYRGLAPPFQASTLQTCSLNSLPVRHRRSWHCGDLVICPRVRGREMGC